MLLLPFSNTTTDIIILMATPYVSDSSHVLRLFVTSCFFSKFVTTLFFTTVFPLLLVLPAKTVVVCCPMFVSCLFNRKWNPSNFLKDPQFFKLATSFYLFWWNLSCWDNVTRSFSLHAFIKFTVRTLIMLQKNSFKLFHDFINPFFATGTTKTM